MKIIWTLLQLVLLFFFLATFYTSLGKFSAGDVLMMAFFLGSIVFIQTVKGNKGTTSFLRSGRALALAGGALLCVEGLHVLLFPDSTNSANLPRMFRFIYAQIDAEGLATVQLAIGLILIAVAWGKRAETE